MPDPAAITLSEQLPALITAVEKVARAVEDVAETFRGSDPIAVNLQEMHATLKRIADRLESK